jgi:hypothetical protein
VAGVWFLASIGIFFFAIVFDYIFFVLWLCTWMAFELEKHCKLHDIQLSHVLVLHFMATLKNIRISVHSIAGYLLPDHSFDAYLLNTLY